YQSIIFDIGNVLIKWQPTTVAEQLFPNTSAPVIIQTLFQNPIWLEFDRGTVDIPGLTNLAVTQYNFDPLLTTQLLSALPYHLPPIHEMTDSLLKAKEQGYRVYILSNMPKPFYEALIKNNSFFKACDGLVASYQINSIKPELDIYKHLLQKFTIDPTSTLFIDDVEANIFAGNSLGIDGIVCKTPETAAQLLESYNILKK
ncbi:HAD family phosphatase, partial [Candidatus Dependentiae bacterium]|nr:HAD family phosphatase [Candidatus Dependentiae bacterium]